MPKKYSPNQDRLKNVLKITLGEEAQERKKHNTRPQPGDVRTASSAESSDRLTRALKRSQAASLKERELEKEGRPEPGEIYTAESGPEQTEQERERVKKFLRLAQTRFKLAAEAEAHGRAEALDDLSFRVGEQWPKDLELERQLDGRPCLTMNRLPAVIRQVTNEQRQQRPTVQVNPVGDGADVDTAEIFQGVIRHIEVISDAEIAIDSAFDHMVTCGFGDWRVITEVIDEEANQQELKVKKIKNSFAVYWDPAAVEPCLEDAGWCFLVEDVPIAEYQHNYRDTQAASLADFSSIGDNAPDWATKDTIRVAEYFHVEDDENGKQQVVWSKINAVEIIDEQVWPGKWIPIIRVLGDDLDVNGKRHLAGLVRHAKDPQRMYNYWISAATEMIALAPKAPFVAAEGQLEDHEKEWQEANTRSQAVLQYKPVSAGGGPAPPPQRQPYEPPIQAINQMTRQADLDLKAVTGLFDPPLGQNRTDQSGRAINSLQRQGDIATLNFSDNLARSIRHYGRILIDLIPKIYDAARVQRIIKPDGSIDHVVVHNGQPEEGQALLTDQVRKIYDIGVGRYDVTLQMGPSYQTKRQEAVAGQLALVQAYPAAFPIIGDMLVSNMDWPQSKEMAARLHKTLPPNLMDENEDSPESQVQMLQAKLAAIGQQHQQLTMIVQKQNDIINQKQVEQQGKMMVAQMQEMSRQEIVKMQELTKLSVAQINASKDAAQSFADAEIARFKLLHEPAHEAAMQAQDQAHAAEMAQQQPVPEATQ
jgi:hypothetical protein